MTFGKSLRIHLTTVEDTLGTASSNPDLHKEHIAANSKDRAKMKEELAALPAEDLEEKSKTGFSRTADGGPMLWDYQIKGFIKEAVNAVREMPDSCVSKEKRLSKWSYKKTLDKLIMVGTLADAKDRKLPLILPEGAEIGEKVRPLRAETMRGERVALACSETVPPGTQLSFQIILLDPRLEAGIREALDYGQWNGLGQWRSAGWGRFNWEEIQA